MTIETYLQSFDYWIGNVELRCWIDFEPPDKSTGQNASAYLAHAYVGASGMDVSEILDASVRNKIEEEAAYHLSKGE